MFFSKEGELMITQMDFYYSPHQSNRKLHIYTPDKEGLFPVMYFFDGHNLFFDKDATYGKSWGLYDFLENFEKDFIIVGIECSHKDNQRLEEYCPYNFIGSLWKDLDHLGHATMEWIVHEIKPYIDTHFPVYTNRECTGIAGSSMGGLMSFYGILHYNDIFSKAACLSSTFTPGKNLILEDLKQTHFDLDTRIYLSFGEKEANRYKRKNVFHTPIGFIHETIKNELEKKHVQVYLRMQEKGKHNEESWEKLNEDYFYYLWF